MTAAQIYVLVLMTAIVAALVAALAFAVLRFVAAAREARSRAREAPTDAAFMAVALQDAITKLRDQEREAQSRAEASERLSEGIVAGITSGLMLVAGDGTVRLMNPAAARLTGFSGEEATGRPAKEVLSGASALAEVVDEALRSGRPIVRRMVTMPPSHAAGEPTHLGVTVSPVIDPRRSGHAVICLFTDLTEVVGREEQLRLKESLARLGELTAGIAHEFRNGLATIHGYARLLDPDALPAAAGTCVRGIRQETEALGDIVSRFLSFARPTQLAVAPVDLSALVARLTDEWRAEAERLGGSVDLSGEFGVVEGDEVLLRQAFDNLGRNAFEACREAGSPPRIAVSGRRLPADRQVAITVSDSGPGIEASARGRIFQPFFTTRQGGTGLGLALVQKIVVTHNGRISASNRREGGAVFEVRLPLESGPLTKV